MTDKSDDRKIRNAYPDRFTVDPVNLEKMGRLLDQLRASVPACDATRKDILNWIVEQFPQELNATHLKDLSGRFYDEEKFLRLALGEVRAAKARGERLSIEDILRRKPQVIVSVRKSAGRRKAKMSELDTSATSAGSAPISVLS